jgi:glutathione S-transferase
MAEETGRNMAVRYELYYWPSIQGRGEFVRLALEDAGADYIDVAREPSNGGLGMRALLDLMDGESVERPPFAPPFLKAGKLIIGQTTNILMFLGDRHGLAPKSDAGRLWIHQLQLTFADFVDEIHDTHHPIASDLYYEDQRGEARRRSAHFLKARAPKYLGYFERVLQRNPSGDKYLAGARRSSADLSLFQVVAGLRYAFPKSMARLEKKLPRAVALHDRIAERPNIRSYLASSRRIAFNDSGIFRQYPELDR